MTVLRQEDRNRIGRLGAAVNIITTDGPAGRSGMTASTRLLVKRKSWPSNETAEDLVVRLAWTLSRALPILVTSAMVSVIDECQWEGGTWTSGLFLFLFSHKL